MNEKIKINMNRGVDNLSKYATKNNDAIRFSSIEEDFRPPFFRDIDRIIYSLSYTRYIDKTQVFTFNENDNISRRMTHVQMVSKIARTIGRALGLNEDLIEAAALGHDLGHVPFGHEGEYILNTISLENNEGYFNHNIQSVRTLMFIEDHGKGKNLCIQTLDAIMCHNGEMVLNNYKPIPKTKDQFMKQYIKSYQEKNIVKTFIPMTLEGCVVRISDIIAYIGKDIEDAIRLRVLKKENIPSNITDVLGTTNREIVNTIISDIVNNSIDQPFIKMSEKIFNAVKELKKFNYTNIYTKANSKERLNLMKKMFYKVFQTYLKDLDDQNLSSDIYNIFLNDMTEEYKHQNSNARIVIDYISGMTDDFLTKQYYKIIDNDL